MIRALASIQARGGIFPDNLPVIEQALRDYDDLLHDPFIKFYLAAKREKWPLTFLPLAHQTGDERA